MNEAAGDRSDVVVPFVFEKLAVRGALIQLQQSWARMRLGQHYADPVMQILGHASAATGLIAQSLEFKGSVTMQVSGDGPLSMLVMQYTDELQMRGMASAEVEAGVDYETLVDQSRCAITIDTGLGERPYQGIVEMVGDSLSASLENYFARSAQIESHMTLLADRSCAGGILLQQMPEKIVPLADDWHRLRLLAATLRISDVDRGIGVPLVGKLFAEDDVRVFASCPVIFRCRCSRQRAEEVLLMVGEDETRSACEEQGKVDVICEYCGQRQSFDSVDVSRMFNDRVVQGPDTVQ